MKQQPVLTVSRDAIVANWRALRVLHGGRETGATVKADAYGLGAIPVVQALHDAGCQRFFVATLQEALELRAAFDAIEIYVFQGVLDGELSDYLAHRLCPVINTIAQLKQWATTDVADNVYAMLHVDSGMRRLGITLDQLNAPDVLTMVRAARIDTLMTHYASASQPDAPLTMQQLEVMQRASALLPALKTSYANSAGHFLSAPYHGDITRPGCALYGIAPCDDEREPMQPVVTLQVPILQRYDIERDGTISYCGTQRVARGMRTVTIAMGYADGLMRCSAHKLYGFIGDYKVPLLGRVTMDMTCFDVSHVPPAVVEQATSIVVMDHRQTVNDLADMFGTIGYEVLTGMGRRVLRTYR